MDEKTRQEINDYCDKVLDMHLSSRPEGKLLFEAIQIIRQLQAEAGMVLNYHQAGDRRSWGNLSRLNSVEGSRIEKEWIFILQSPCRPKVDI